MTTETKPAPGLFMPAVSEEQKRRQRALQRARERLAQVKTKAAKGPPRITETPAEQPLARPGPGGGRLAAAGMPLPKPAFETPPGGPGAFLPKRFDSLEEARAQAQRDFPQAVAEAQASPPKGVGPVGALANVGAAYQQGVVEPLAAAATLGAQKLFPGQQEIEQKFQEARARGEPGFEALLEAYKNTEMPALKVPILNELAKRYAPGVFPEGISVGVKGATELTLDPLNLVFVSKPAVKAAQVGARAARRGVAEALVSTPSGTAQRAGLRVAGIREVAGASQTTAKNRLVNVLRRLAKEEELGKEDTAALIRAVRTNDPLLLEELPPMPPPIEKLLTAYRLSLEQSPSPSTASIARGQAEMAMTPTPSALARVPPAPPVAVVEALPPPVPVRREQLSLGPGREPLAIESPRPLDLAAARARIRRRTARVQKKEPIVAGPRTEPLGRPPEPPTVPPQEVGFPTLPPPEASGARFLAESPLLSDLVKEVVSSGNPVVKWLIGRTGINPSVLAEDPIGKALIAYYRKGVADEELRKVALSASLDSHAQRGAARLGVVLPIHGDGFYGTTGKLWQDVFSRPGDYRLTAPQRALIDDYLRVLNEAETRAQSLGLAPVPTRGEEGWFYVPRQVKGIRGIEIRRPSSPRLQRIYDEATEGYAAGVRYDRDPRATLDLHLRIRQQEIREHELSKLLEPQSITASKLIPESVRQRLTDAIAAKNTAEAAGRKRIQATAQEIGKTPMPSTFGRKLLADPEVQAARAEWKKARTSYARSLEAARRAEVAPGWLFGKQERDIPIAMWRNRYFPREQQKQLVDGLGLFSGQVKPNVFTQAFESLGNTMRFVGSVGDLAMPFLQGQTLLVRNPVAWGRMALRHDQALFDPTVQARLIRDNLPDYQWLASHGVPIGDPEFFTALEAGKGFSPGKILELFPNGEEARRFAQNMGRQSFGRFQAAYNTGLGQERVMFLRALRTGWKGTDSELAAEIRNLTGGLDSRALGVSPSRRAVESMWLSFSPRLFRSTVALSADAIRAFTQLARGMPPTVQQTDALHTLGMWAAAITAAYITTGVALGKSQEEIATGLNPLSGKRFLSHEIMGDWIGVGGQVRAIAQLIGVLVSSAGPGGKPVGDLISGDQFDNPLIAFYRNRAAVGLNITAVSLEGLSGGRWNLYPYEWVDGPRDILKQLGASSIPFTAQGQLEGEQPLTGVLAFTGLRTSPQTKAEAGASGGPGRLPATSRYFVSQSLAERRARARRRRRTPVPRR